MVTPAVHAVAAEVVEVPAAAVVAEAEAESPDDNKKKVVTRPPFLLTIYHQCEASIFFGSRILSNASLLSKPCSNTKSYTLLPVSNASLAILVDAL